ncbi:MAG: hypothetical protein R6X12_02605 [bacterium]
MSKMSVLLLGAAFGLAALAVEHPPVTTIPVGAEDDYPAAPAPAREAVDELANRPVVFSEFWPGLARMTPAEREDCELALEPMPGSGGPDARAEARAISELWNRGEHEAAIERAQGYWRFGNPGEVAVFINRRTPAEPDPAQDFGPDIRIGTRDSLTGCSFDRANDGRLFASFPGLDSNRTRIWSYRSTNNGSNWTELQNFYWNASNYILASAAACHGNYLVIAVVTRGTNAHRSYTARISLSTGNFVPYPGDSWLVQGFASTSGDTIRELAITSSEDQYPGSRVYLFGRTKAATLKFAWSDSSCRAWRTPNTGLSVCHDALDCAYNSGYSERFLWVSFARWVGTGDTARLGFGYYTTEDTLFHASSFTNAYVYRFANRHLTAVTVYRDTLQFGFVTRGGKQVRQVYSWDVTDPTWYQSPMSDTLTMRDGVEVTGRRGGGFAIGYRNYSGTEDRHMLFRHASRVQGPYTDPDTVSENRPHYLTRLRLEKLSDGVYGAVWVSWNQPPYRAAYFDRVTLTGIEEPRLPTPVPAGLAALPTRHGVRLAFDNPAEGPVRLRVFDRTGRQVLCREARLAAGRQSFDVALETGGVLFAVVDAGGRQLTTKFSFAR